AKGEQFDLIVSNPPYIESGTIARLPREVRLFDPRRALDGGADGLEAFRAITRGVRPHILPGGWIALEIGWGQGEAVSALVHTAGLGTPIVKKDLAGLDRVVAVHHV